MSAVNDDHYDCSFVSIHYIICECGLTFPSENGLRDHLEKVHPHKRERKEFKCGVCGSIFSTEDACISHYEAKHFNDTDIKHEEEDLECIPDMSHEVVHEQKTEIIYEPDEQSDHQYELPYKVELTEQEYQEEDSQEEVLQEETQDEESQDVPLLKSVRNWEGPVSEAETVQATQMLVKANGNKQHPQVRPPPLRMVRDADTGQLVLVFNRARPTKKRTSSKPARTQKTLKDIVCEVCGKKYASSAALKYHQRVHTGEKPYRCHLCPKAFTMPLFLQIHVRTHTGERPYQCPECPKAFSNKAALLRHERVHTGVKPYSCPMCLKSFTQSNSMKLHVATVHLKQPAPYKSKTRRMKEAARGLKSLNKIKAFAPSSNEERRNSEPDTQSSDGEYEVVISEEVQEPDGTCYEVVYEGEEDEEGDS